MRLKLHELEDTYLHDEKKKPVAACIWALLYLAARGDGIDIVDAVQVLRRYNDDGDRINDYPLPGGVTCD